MQTLQSLDVNLNIDILFKNGLARRIRRSLGSNTFVDFLKLGRPLELV